MSNMHRMMKKRCNSAQVRLHILVMNIVKLTEELIDMKIAVYGLLAALVLTGCAAKEEKPALPKVTNAACHEPERTQEGDPCDGDVLCALKKNGNVVYFSLDSDVLDYTAQKKLSYQAEWLLRHPDVQLVVEGHADERGTREYNLALGGRRAQAVYNYLLASGVKEDRLQTVSYGKERPAILGDSENSWSQNRRAVLMLQGMESVPKPEAKDLPKEPTEQTAPIEGVSSSAPVAAVAAE